MEQSSNRLVADGKVYVLCDRCGLVKLLGRFTTFEINLVKLYSNVGTEQKPRWEVFETKDVGTKRGLCVECNEVVSKSNYDRQNA